MPDVFLYERINISLSYFPSGSQDVIYQYFFKDKKAVLNNEYIKRMKNYKHNITNDILEQITTALKKSKNTEKRYVDTFIKKYVRHFKSEQELIERIEILMVDYHLNILKIKYRRYSVFITIYINFFQ